MKRSLISIFVIAACSIPCHAQWRNANRGARILAFGVHDTSFFIGVVPQIPQEAVVQRYDTAATNPSLWVPNATGIDPSQGNVTSFASLGRYLFAGMKQTGGGAGTSWRSSDNGANWSASASGNVCTANRYVFNATGGIYRSSDSGAYNPWQLVSNFKATVLASSGVCVYGSNSTSVWRSLDTGNNWTQIHPPFIGTITPMDTLLFIVGNGSVAKSTDSGTNWSTVTVDSAGVPAHVNCLATDGKNLFAGTPTGILVSTDTGHSWTSHNDGMMSAQVFPDHRQVPATVTVMAVFDTLLFAEVDYGNGNYYLLDRPVRELTGPPDAVQLPSPGDTIEIYPNPANSLVFIRSSGTFILDVRVLNVLGEDVLNIPAQRETDMTLDFSKLPSGTYFLEIQTTNGSMLRKVIRE